MVKVGEGRQVIGRWWGITWQIHGIGRDGRQVVDDGGGEEDDDGDRQMIGGGREMVGSGSGGGRIYFVFVSLTCLPVHQSVSSVYFLVYMSA